MPGGRALTLPQRTVGPCGSSVLLLLSRGKQRPGGPATAQAALPADSGSRADSRSDRDTKSKSRGEGVQGGAGCAEVRTDPERVEAEPVMLLQPPSWVPGAEPDPAGHSSFSGIAGSQVRGS